MNAFQDKESMTMYVFMLPRVSYSAIGIPSYLASAAARMMRCATEIVMLTYSKNNVSLY